MKHVSYFWIGLIFLRGQLRNNDHFVFSSFLIQKTTDSHTCFETSTMAKRKNYTKTQPNANDGTSKRKSNVSQHHILTYFVLISQTILTGYCN
jgi:hypothetical protein